VATTNRELAFLRSALVYAKKGRTIRDVPFFPIDPENNVRKGFVRDDQYEALARATMEEGLWLRTAFEIAYRFGWRSGETFALRVRHLDFIEGVVWVDDSKNSDGKHAYMTGTLRRLLTACVAGKQPDDPVLDRDGRPIVDYRDAWQRAVKAAGCEGLLFHDLCRTGMRNLRRMGIPESLAMRIAGRKTASIFRRYDIVDEGDLKDASKRLERRMAKLVGRDKKLDHTTTIQGGGRSTIQASKTLATKHLN
jgi:integrase